MNRGKGRAIQRRTSRAIESHLQTVGWISRQKISRLPAEGEAFLLTSLFIEPPISKCDDYGPAIGLAHHFSGPHFVVHGQKADKPIRYLVPLCLSLQFGCSFYE